MTRSLLLMSLCLTLAASPASRAQAPDPPAGYPKVGEPSVVAVTSPGGEPRRPLRYAVRAGYRGHMNMDMTMSIAMGVGGQTMPAVNVPTVRIGADMQVTTVTSDGDMTVTLAFTGMNLQDPSASADAAALLPLQSMSADFKNLRGTATITSRGVTRDFEMDTSRVTNPQLSQMMTSVKNSLASLSIPLPEEALGVGARWEVRQALDSNGITLFQKAQYELAALDATTATLNVTMDQTAPSQAMHNARLPPGTNVSIDSITSNGAGTTKLTFDALVPAGEMTSKSAMVMSMKAGEAAPQKMTVETSMKLVVAPGRE